MLGCVDLLGCRDARLLREGQPSILISPWILATFAIHFVRCEDTCSRVHSFACGLSIFMILVKRGRRCCKQLSRRKRPAMPMIACCSATNTVGAIGYSRKTEGETAPERHVTLPAKCGPQIVRTLATLGDDIRGRVRVKRHRCCGSNRRKDTLCT